MLTGPDLLNNLVGVLLRFRNHKIAIVADIEATYHQVRVNKSDANALRFFWQDDSTQDVPEIYQMQALSGDFQHGCGKMHLQILSGMRCCCNVYFPFPKIL